MLIRLLSSRIFRSQFKVTAIILCPFVFIACKKETIEFVMNPSKERLTGDTAILVGTWNWIYTDHEYGWCEGDQWQETLTPDSEGTNFYIQFKTNGIVQFYKDQELIAEHRTVFRFFTINSNVCNAGQGTSLAINLDGIEEMTLGSCVYNDTMRAGFNGFIFESEPGCESYVNFFLKQ